MPGTFVDYSDSFVRQVLSHRYFLARSVSVRKYLAKSAG